MKWGNSLLAFEEDVKTRGLLDWIKAHTSGFKPLHRYEGVLEVKEGELIFSGRDVKKARGFRLKIPLKDIADVYLGFDDVFRGREERAWPWNKPLRIRYRTGSRVKTVYLFAEFRRKFGIIRTSSNREVLETIERLRRKGSGTVR